MRWEDMTIIKQYSENIYPRVKKCARCGGLRLQNCLHCTQEETCETFPNCEHPPAEFYPPELAYIGQEYGNASPKVLFLAQIVAWNLENVAYRENGQMAYVVPAHDTYEDFLEEYRVGFASYNVVKNKYGALDIYRQITAPYAPENPITHIAYTNAAKCPNRSGMESRHNLGYTASQARSDIAVMLANCREHILEEIQVLDPDVIVSFDRSFLPALAEYLKREEEDKISLVAKIGGRARLCMSFYHPSMAGVNYARAPGTFDARVQEIRAYLKK